MRFTAADQAFGEISLCALRARYPAGAIVRIKVAELI
jgi:hypothetical protein